MYLDLTEQEVERLLDALSAATADHDAYCEGGGPMFDYAEDEIPEFMAKRDQWDALHYKIYKQSRPTKPHWEEPL